MKYKQSSFSKQTKKDSQVQIKSTIKQQWKISTQNPLQILPYSIHHVYLSKICDPFHTMKLMFFQNTGISMKQIIQGQHRQKGKHFQSMQYMFTSRLRYPFQKMKELIMFSDQSLSSQHESGLESYMRMIQLRKVMEQALASLQPTYQILRKKALIWGMINLKDNMKHKRKYEAYNDQISVEYFCQTAQNIIRNLTKQVVSFSFYKLLTYYQYESQQIQKIKQIKRHTFDTFGKSLDEQFKNISLSNQSVQKLQAKKYLNRQNAYSRQKKFITRTQNKSQVRQSKKRENNYININDYQDNYQESNHRLSNEQKNRKTKQTDSHNNHLQQHRAQTNQQVQNNNRQHKNNKYVKRYEEQEGLQQKINQMPTQRTNYRYSHQEEHYQSNIVDQEEDNSERYSTPFHRVEYQHLPITQRIEKKQFRSEQYIENNQQIGSQSQGDVEENIVQQIYIIRNHKEKPKRRPDHFVKVPILSSDINVVQIQNPKKRIYQYQEKSSNFYRQHACKDCKYCKIVESMQQKINNIKKITGKSFKYEENGQKFQQKIQRRQQNTLSSIVKKSWKQ